MAAMLSKPTWVPATGTMNGVKVDLTNAEWSIVDDAFEEVRWEGPTSFSPYHGVGECTPDKTETHRHVAGGREGGSGQYAQPIEKGRPIGIKVPLVLRDTDEVSHCGPGCDGDHDTWYVKEWWCPLCEQVLTATTGERSKYVRTRPPRIEVTVQVPFDALTGGESTWTTTAGASERTLVAVLEGVYRAPAKLMNHVIEFRGHVHELSYGSSGQPPTATFEGRAPLPERLSL